MAALGPAGDTGRRGANIARTYEMAAIEHQKHQANHNINNHNSNKCGNKNNNNNDENENGNKTRDTRAQPSDIATRRSP